MVFVLGASAAAGAVGAVTAVSAGSAGPGAMRGTVNPLGGNVDREAGARGTVTCSPTPLLLPLTSSPVKENGDPPDADASQSVLQSGVERPFCGE